MKVVGKVNITIDNKNYLFYKIGFTSKNTQHEMKNRIKSYLETEHQIKYDNITMLYCYKNKSPIDEKTFHTTNNNLKFKYKCKKTHNSKFKKCDELYLMDDIKYIIDNEYSEEYKIIFQLDNESDNEIDNVSSSTANTYNYTSTNELDNEFNNVSNYESDDMFVLNCLF